MLIGLIHMRLKELMRRQNIETAKKLLKIARDKGVKLAILPSLFPVGNVIEVYDNSKRLKGIVKNLSEKIPGEATETFIDLATEAQIYLIAGSIIEQAGPKLFVTTLIVSPQGEILGKYRKMAISERERNLGISTGKEPTYITLDHRYGLITEDDIFVPEVSRILRYKGVSVILGTLKPYPLPPEVIKSVSVTRAIEEETPFIMVGQEVEDRDGNLLGSAPSIVTLPDGSVYREADEPNTVVTVETNVLIQETNKARKVVDLISDDTVVRLCKGIRKVKEDKEKKAKEKEVKEEELEEEEEE